MDRRWIFLLVCAAVVLLAGSIDVRVIGEDVVALTPETFEEEVGLNKGALVEFYAPRCGHCKELAPEYEKLAGTFKKIRNVLIAKYDVSGFPTMKWFPTGSLEPKRLFWGPDAEALTEFVKEEAGTRAKLNTPPSEVVALTPANFDSIVLDKTKDVLVEFEVHSKSPVIVNHEQLKKGSRRLQLMYIEKGDEYAKKEVDRLERILEGAVSPNKVDDFVVKKNMLTSFVN